MKVKGKFVRTVLTVALSCFLFSFLDVSAQAASTHQNEAKQALSVQSTQVVEKKRPNLVKCLLGGGGSALGGFAAGGPIGYWAGAAMGYAQFCMN